ncbi:hypothetical protein ACJIZ3_023709 [Penstemon smallii]|uniref:Uncharacterized protein n=1 Tax=Penstemon smallii TaxID=265156 RepID=A0ABD3TST1_9LAMI
MSLTGKEKSVKREKLRPSYVTTGRTLRAALRDPYISHRSLHDPIAVLCPFSHICSQIHELYLSEEPKCGRR